VNVVDSTYSKCNFPYENRKGTDFLLHRSVGDPIVQATDACHLAASGEVVVSSNFYALLSTTGIHTITINDHGNGKTTLHAGGDEFDSYAKRFKKRPEEIAKSRAITHHVEGLGLDCLKEYRRLIALYCHPVVCHYSDFDRKRSGKERHVDQMIRDDVEMRNVFVAFLNVPVPLHRATGEGMVDRAVVDKINCVFNLVSHELLHCKGYIESFIDDKGFSLMITFGLRGSMFPNLVSSVALPAVLNLQEVLMADAAVRCHIGSTNGNVHCGFLGSNQRHEYTVLGPPVNLAARLMTSDLNCGLLVDKSVPSVSSDAYTFEQVGTTMVKGFSESIMTYTPVLTGSIEDLHAGQSALFVGRQRELEIIRSKSDRTSKASNVVLIVGASGIGKSEFLSQASSTAYECFDKGEQVEMAHIWCDAKSSFIPFGALRSFLQSMLKRSDLRSFHQSDFAANLSLSPRLIHILATFLQTEGGCLDLLQMMDQKDLVALSQCICHLLVQRISVADRFIISIDDCHRLDTFSWRTLGMLLKAKSGILLLGTATTSSFHGFRMDEETKELIFDMFSRASRLSLVELDCLPMGEVATLIAKSLGSGVIEVSNDLLHNVYAESGGHPLFVKQVLDRLKGSPKVELCEDLIVHRLDCLSSDERRCLAVASCLGSPFSCDEMHKILSKEDHVSLEYCASTLQSLARIDILRVTDHNNSNSNNNAAVPGPTSLLYSFRDGRWRQKMLDITLKSAQQDVARLLANTTKQSYHIHATTTTAATRVCG
jgi:AAA ATPase domain/Adenylate and Guanylate cyclase catalytic domain